MAFNYEPAGFLTFGGNAAQCAKDLLADGSIGLFWRPDVARIFRACGEAGCELVGVKTSCGVDSSACWDWAGRPHTIARGKGVWQGGHIGGSLVGSHGWLECGPQHWVRNDGSAMPDVGDIITFGTHLEDTHHVELVVEAQPDARTILTAAGGQSPDKAMLEQAGIWGHHDKTVAANGTVMRMGAGPKDLDGHGISGWFSARSVAAAEGLEDPNR